MKKFTQIVGVVMLTLTLAFGTAHAAPKKVTQKKVVHVNKKKGTATKVTATKVTTPAKPATSPVKK